MDNGEYAAPQMSCRIQSLLQRQHAKNNRISHPIQSASTLCLNCQPNQNDQNKKSQADDLHEVSNVRGSPGELLQSVHRNVDHIFLDRKVHNYLLLSFPGELFKIVLWFTSRVPQLTMVYLHFLCHA